MGKDEKSKRTYGKIVGIILYPDSKRGNFNSAEILNDLWNYYSPTCDIAYALHDQDKDSDGNIKKAHIHFDIRSRNSISIRPFQEKWKISGHCIQILDNWEASIQYLVHRNPNYDESDGNFIYDPKIIHSNFPLERYFDNNKTSDPEYVQLLKILNWATHNKANYYQILKYVGENGYFSAYRKSYKMIVDILGPKPWLVQSEVTDSEEDIPKEFIKF